MCFTVDYYTNKNRHFEHFPLKFAGLAKKKKRKRKKKKMQKERF